MNYMEQVAKILGVELNKKFDLQINDGKVIEGCVLTQGGFEAPDDCPWAISLDAMNNMLSGKYQIVKEPFCPHLGDTYWYVLTDGTVAITTFYDWNELDLSRAYMGNCFPTKEEAKGHIDEIMGKYKKIQELCQ